jgi:hypothetical protein
MSLEKCDVTHAYRFRQLTIVGLREGSGHVDQHISRDHLKAILMEKNFFYPDDLERFSLKGPVPEHAPDRCIAQSELNDFFDHHGH